MSFIARFEAACASLVENAFARVFPSELEPERIGRKLVATMESTPSDTYLVHVHPNDYARFAPHLSVLEAQWSQLLAQLASTLDLAIDGPVRVVVHDDTSVVRGSVRIEALIETSGLAAPAARAGGPLLLSVASAFGDAKMVPLRDGLSIGRGSDNDIVLSDPSVSRRHAHVVRDGASFVLFDDGSSNGTMINGTRVKRAPLALGDEIRLGDARLRVESSGG